jgi:hypothetical protein
VAEQVQIHRWPGGWCLVGDGPSYLLFDVRKKGVMHLASGLYRALRLDLKGYSAIGKDGELEGMVRMLALASADAIYDLDERPNAAERKWAAYTVVREIKKLSYQHSFDERLFTGHLRRLCTLLRAERQLALAHGPPGVPENVPAPPRSFFACAGGKRFLFTPWARFKVEPSSQIAQCARELWRKEQVPLKNRTVLYRIPTRLELRLYLGLADEASIAKLCRREGFDWLAAAKPYASRRR